MNQFEFILMFGNNFDALGITLLCKSRIFFHKFVVLVSLAVFLVTKHFTISFFPELLFLVIFVIILEVSELVFLRAISTSNFQIFSTPLLVRCK